MSRIREAILDCSVYLYASVTDAQTGEHSGGSGFVVAVPSAIEGWYVYAVTNSHVIREGQSPVLRINTVGNDVKILEFDQADWFHHPNGDDVAVVPLVPDATRYQLRFLQTGMFVTQKNVDDKLIGAGAGVYMIGRFVGYDGKQHNEPIIRFGNMAIGSVVQIAHPRGYMQDSFLVETRSLSGFSGSPVLVELTEPPNDKGWWQPRGMCLLGIDWGHKRILEPVLEKNGEEPVSEGWVVKSNSGISCIVPAWKLLELLNMEVLDEMRRKNDASMKKELDEAKQPKKDVNVTLDTLTKSKFEKTLEKVFTTPTHSISKKKESDK